MRRRYQSGREDALRWHLERYAELARELDRAGADDMVLDTDHVGPREIAERIMAACNQSSRYHF